MAEILTYAEAEEIYHVMEEGIDRRDEDIVGMYKDMIARAVKYANIRAGWNLLSTAEKREKDPSRTSAHDAFIASLGSIARLEGDAESSGENDYLMTENESEILPALLLCLRGFRRDSLVFGAPSGALFLYII